MLPAQLKIGGILWQVKEVPASELGDGAVADQCSLGQTIRIAVELSEQMKKRCLLHEIIHCIDSELDHDVVDLLSGALYQVMEDNKLAL